MKFEDILEEAKEVAYSTNCILETADYLEYGWRSISLLTDKFGGCAVSLCYLIDEERCFDWIHSPEEQEVDLKTFYEYAREKVLKLQKVRLTDDLYDFINSEY